MMKNSTENKVIREPDEEAIRAFLLGRLDGDAQANFEAELIGSDQLDARVRQAEFYLADDFVAERLDRFDRQRFMKNFLLTEERRRTWLVSGALHDRFSRGANRFEISRDVSSWAEVFTLRRLAWKFAFAITVLLLLFGSAWLVTKEPNLVKKIIPKRVWRRAPAVPTPQEANHPVNTAPASHQQSESSLPEHESSPPNAGTAPLPVVATVNLAAEIQAGNPELSVIKLGDATSGVVRFRLSFAGDRSQPLRIDIEKSDGQVVFSGETLPVANAAAGTIDFDVSVSALKAGDYQIRLTGGSQQTRYQFRVE